ncbi:MAG: carbohydrate-binding family V/XII protein [Gammaproteobacteria bacterium]|nr:carbohydrate-binding family V/XII protein [Gammaproteobacteria bacterium]
MGIHQLKQLIGGMGEVVRDVNSDLESRLDAKLAALEERMTTGINLADCYQGAHHLGKGYRRGNLVTHQGSLWLCMADSDERPGQSSAWRLIVKRGKDA